MNMRAMVRRLPLRLSTGVLILNSGLSKLNADPDTAKQLQGFAATTYPFLGKLEPQQFAKCLAIGEIATGAALVVPIVPARIAGAALTAFSLGLVGMYLRTPGMRQPGSLKPTEQGLAMAKDVWMFGIGLSLVLDDLLGEKEQG
jgi:uncharacterized membrane protein YphA (DoxX/SURF4 family)